MSLHQCNDLNSHHKSPLLPAKRETGTQIFKKKLSIYCHFQVYIFVYMYV